MMSEFEKVVRNFKLFTNSYDLPIPVTYNPKKFLYVYDKEEDYAPARIINITNDPDGIAIEIKYIKDDTTRCYLLSDKTDIALPENDQPHDYFYKGKDSFDCLFITENQVSKFKEKVWPLRFDDAEADPYLEYIETIDPNHSNYKFIWHDGFDRENEFIVTLSREDINELLDDAEEFMYKLQDTIIIMGLWTTSQEEE
jgi:hypothetical protein